MADTLCGPSNSLQTFQKATQADRSLQQDRFTSRPSPGPQGFRSEHGAPAGLLDPQFEAFKNGAPPGLIPEQQIPHPSQHHFPRQQTPSFGRQAEEAVWASDFQRLQISQPAQAPSMYPPQQQQQPSFRGWHQEFQRHHSPGPQHRAQMSLPQRTNFTSQRPMLQPQFPGYSQATYNQPQAFDKGKSRQQEVEADAAAFEAEFEAQARHLMREQSTAEQVDAHGMDSTQEKLDAVNDSAARVYQNYRDMQDAQQEQQHQQQDDTQAQNQYGGQDFNATASDAQRAHEKHTAGNLARHNESLDEMQQALQQMEERNQALLEKARQDMAKQATDDDLAHTAGELLDRVSDNTSQKFKDSSFLALMTQLRDREVRVEGDQFVDVPGASGAESESAPRAPLQRDDVSHASAAQPLDYLYADGSALEGSNTTTRSATETGNNERYMAGALGPDVDVDSATLRAFGNTLDAQTPSRPPPDPMPGSERDSQPDSTSTSTSTSTASAPPLPSTNTTSCFPTPAHINNLNLTSQEHRP